MNPRFLSRYNIYTAGMIILACGISLNTKTDLGVSPLISMPFAISQIWHLNRLAAAAVFRGLQPAPAVL